MRKIIEYLPKGWEEKARELGAMQRNSGVIRTAETLLRLNMLYVTNDGSFQMAATGLAMTEGKAISKVAAYKRIGKSAQWLRWMAQKMCEAQGATLPKPKFLGERHVKLYDASDETTKGEKKDTWRLHYCFDLFEFQCGSMEVTTNKEGEKLTRHEMCAGDIAVADRIYCTMSGIEHVLAAGADFVIRFKSKVFHLYGPDGKRMDILPLLSGLEPLESTSMECFYKRPTGPMRPLRLVAMKKDAKAIEESRRKMLRKQSKKQEKAPHADTAELNKYIILATSLSYTNEQILEIYRARWQIEQVFYRLKSLFGYGEVPSKRENTVLAWFYGKLLLAALCETVLKSTAFPPELEPIIAKLIATQFVDRLVGHP